MRPEKLYLIHDWLHKLFPEGFMPEHMLSKQHFISSLSSIKRMNKCKVSVNTSTKESQQPQQPLPSVIYSYKRLLYLYSLVSLVLQDGVWYFNPTSSFSQHVGKISKILLFQPHRPAKTGPLCKTNRWLKLLSPVIWQQKCFHSEAQSRKLIMKLQAYFPLVV